MAVALISACLAAGTAACSAAGSGGQQASSSQPSGSHSGLSAGDTDQAMTVMRQLARCIRSHGMPAFPDPVINPLTNGPDWPPDAPRIPSTVEQACQSLINQLPPDVQNSQPPTAASMQALLRFAHCMRSHRLPYWPDPNALGEFPMTTQMSIQFKAGDRSATSACIHFVPGGSQYLQFVGVPTAGSGNG
jgi:hypothetical protein